MRTTSNNTVPKSGLWLMVLLLICACQAATPAKQTAPREIHTPTYDLLLPSDQKALLILFPCFPCDAADTRAESPGRNNPAWKFVMRA